MGVQSFNDRFLGNADVPNTGTSSGAMPSGPGVSSGGIPRSVAQADGTSNLGTVAVTKMAGRSDAGKGKSSIPAAVDKYSDGEV